MERVMGKMVEGVWKTDWYQSDEDGSFNRPDTVFRDWVKADGSTEFAPEEGRYHLYVAWACPWAHRTLITRKLKGLEDAIDISVVHWFMADEGWEFKPEVDGCTPDHLFGSDYLRQVYSSADEEYTGRVTVPVLWDKETQTIVNNESREIIRMFDHEFSELAQNDIDLAPPELVDEVEELMTAIYEPVNNGVYRCGFATSQKAYEKAATELFEALDHWEEVLSERRYLCGSQFTEADICLFATLLRFDPVYFTHFKCNVRQIRDYPNLWNYTKDIYQMPGITETLNLDHTKKHYYASHETLNPTRIVPVGPDIDYSTPHDRNRLG